MTKCLANPLHSDSSRSTRHKRVDGAIRNPVSRRAKGDQAAVVAAGAQACSAASFKRASGERTYERTQNDRRGAA
jgi:hypothetical protein